MRNLMNLMRLSAASFLLLAAATPALAVDGCKAILCFAAKDPMSIPDCVSTVEEVESIMAMGGGFPSCDALNSSGNNASGTYAKSGAEQFYPCAESYGPEWSLQSNAGTKTFMLWQSCSTTLVESAYKKQGGPSACQTHGCTVTTTQPSRNTWPYDPNAIVTFTLPQQRTPASNYVDVYINDQLYSQYWFNLP